MPKRERNYKSPQSESDRGEIQVAFGGGSWRTGVAVALGGGS